MEPEKSVHIKEILALYPQDRRHSLAVLQKVQKEYGYISPNNLMAISSHLGVPVSEIFSIATFYKALSLDKKGRCIIKVCDGTACHIRGSAGVLDEVKRALKIKEGETTPDGLFSIEIVNCVGSCAMAPVVIRDKEYFGNVKTGEASGIIDEAKVLMMAGAAVQKAAGAAVQKAADAAVQKAADAAVQKAADAAVQKVTDAAGSGVVDRTGVAAGKKEATWHE